MPETYDKDELLNRPGRLTRKTIVRVLGEKLGRNSPAYLRENLVLDNERDGLHTIDFGEIPLCGNNHTITDQVRIKGRCEMCDMLLCSQDGCALQCVVCGAVVCRRHSKTYGEKTYCSRHWPIHYWLKFWGLE